MWNMQENLLFQGCSFIMFHLVFDSKQLLKGWDLWTSSCHDQASKSSQCSMLVGPPNDVGMWGLFWHFKLWVPRRDIYVDVVWDNNSRRTLAFMAPFAQAKRIQKVVSHGKVDQTRSPHINSTMLRGSQFHRNKNSGTCGCRQWWTTTMLSLECQKHRSTQLWPAKCDISSLLIFLKGWGHLKSAICRL